MDLINLSGSEGKSRASVLQQGNKTPVISSSSSLHSSQALTRCPGNLRVPLVCVLVEHERGLEKPRGENDVSSERIKSPRFGRGCGILSLSHLRNSPDDKEDKDLSSPLSPERKLVKVFWEVARKELKEVS